VDGHGRILRSLCRFRLLLRRQKRSRAQAKHKTNP
jgi:hypothetical protein